MERITIEQRVVDTVLQRTTDTLTLDGEDYPIAAPTLATIIMTSELVATLPTFRMDDENLLYEVLKNARYCRTLGRLAAVLILGAARVQENRQVPKDTAEPKKRSYFSRILRWRVRKNKNEETVAEVDKLAETVLNYVSPATLQAVLTRRLIDMQITDFFALTTSLTTRANQIKPTREVDEATASGE